MLEDYCVAWNSHDAEKLVSVSTDDLVYEDVPLSAIQRNKKESKDSWNMFFTTRSQLRLEVKAVFAAHDRVGGEWIMSGAHSRDWPGMPAAGKSFSVPGTSICEPRGVS